MDSKFCSEEIPLMYTISVHRWSCLTKSRETKMHCGCKNGSIEILGVLRGDDFLPDLFDYYSLKSSLLFCSSWIETMARASRDWSALRAGRRDDLHADQLCV